MDVVITGGSGFIGLALARRLAERDDVERLTLLDAAPPPPGTRLPGRAEAVVGDVCDREVVRGLLAPKRPVVFHLASIVSAGAERDFDLALRVNLDGTRNVLEACRAAPGLPRVVFASTLAVFGGSEMPETVTDSLRPVPQTTYGATKAACELLVNDYSRKGFLDGRVARLPTVIIRPGAPNAAASSFASAVFREPLAGVDYALPVSLRTRVPVIGAGTAVDCLVRLAELEAEALGDDRTLNLPSLSVTVEEMIESVQRLGGERGLRVGRIEVREDAEIARIVDTWPLYASSDRARALGLPQDGSLDPIVADFLAERDAA
jgi:nucleoside-diphosphate-sugar epimerase